MIVLKVFVAWFVLAFSVGSVADELMQFSSALNKTRYQSLIGLLLIYGSRFIK